MFHPPMGSVKCRAVPALGEVLLESGSGSVLSERIEADGEEAREVGGVLKSEHVLVAELSVGDEGDRLAGAAEWIGVAGADAEQLDAVRGGALVALRHDEVEAGEEAARDVGEWHLAVELRDESEPLRRGDGVGVDAGLAVPPGVRAGMVDLEAVRVVLDGADAQAELHELWDDLLDQGRLARVALADDGDESRLGVGGRRAAARRRACWG